MLQFPDEKEVKISTMFELPEIKETADSGKFILVTHEWVTGSDALNAEAIEWAEVYVENIRRIKEAGIF